MIIFRNDMFPKFEGRVVLPGKTTGAHTLAKSLQKSRDRSQSDATTHKHTLFPKRACLKNPGTCFRPRLGLFGLGWAYLYIVRFTNRLVPISISSKRNNILSWAFPLQAKPYIQTNQLKHQGLIPGPGPTWYLIPNIQYPN